MSRFFGYFFLLAGLAMMILTVIKFRMWIPALFFLAIAGLGFYWLSITYKTSSQRKAAFIHGTAFFATVEKHERQFNPLKSERDYTILLRPDNGEFGPELIKVVYKNKSLWENATIGSKVLGLAHKDFYFFGESVGVRFELAKDIAP